MGTRIVIIDNDESIRKLLLHNLESKGYEALHYDYSQIGLIALEQLHPDLIILDFNIRDDGQGWNFLQMLKMEDATAKIPVIIISTALRFSAELDNYLLTRFIHVVNKPFALDTFLILIQKTLTLASHMGSLFSSDHILPILVVEDSDALREAVTTLLGFEGYLFATAENGLLALNAVSEADHCLILLDIDMPIMNGFEFLTAYERQLRPHSPVIILSGEQNILTKVLPAFVIGVIPKPFEIRQLLDAVEKYAQRV